MTPPDIAARTARRRARGLLAAAGLTPSLVLFSTGWPARPGEIVFWTLVCAALPALVPARWLVAAVWAQLGLLWPLAVGWLGIVATTGSPPGDALLLATLTASRTEVRDAMRLGGVQPVMLVLGAAALIVSVLAWRAARRARPGAAQAREPAAAAAFVVLLALFGATQADGLPALRGLASQQARGWVPLLAHAALSKEALTLAVNIATLGRERALGQQVRRAGDAPRTFGAAPGLVVYAVGESLRADALQVAGRGPWSAALQQRLAAGLGVRLPDACAYASATAQSVPALLTAAETGDLAGARTLPTLLARAKAGGARTATISNHQETLVPESGHDWATQTAVSERIAYDDQAVQALADFAARHAGTPTAVVLHLYGQHFPYAERYPADAFAAEPPALAPAALEQLRYGRAAEYGLKTLLDAAAVLDARPDPAVLVFTPDHGENLLADGSARHFHALPTSSRADTIVPVLVLWNRAFAEAGGAAGGAVGRAALQALQAASAPIAHRDVARLVLALMGDAAQVKPTAAPQTLSGAQRVPCDALPR